ncbi:MAG: bifunctional riboflavin kinase/FAD synthetase [Prevotella sp.]|nr:bifunctional riboflavin kinase/FAD synthetase [Prevotella sp.]
MMMTKNPQVATIGFFDGVHRGHRYLIDQMITVATEAGMESMVITFDRHPRQVLHSDYLPQMLSTFEEKKALLKNTPADHIEILTFDEQLAALSAHDFMKEVLRERLNVRKLVIGYDNRFGHNRSEGFEDYVRYGKELGIEVIQAMPLSEPDKEAISSSYIRACLLVGNVWGANEALGYAYSLTGRVTDGFHEGRKIGFPTANLDTDETGKLVPASGVYAVHVQLENEQHLRLAMMNIGMRPTYDGHMQTLEVHIFDFNGDIYGQQLRVVFDRRIRNEMKFSSPQELAKQLEKDKEEVRRIYA